jgi:hypothetical protein
MLEDENVALKVQRTCREMMPEALRRLSLVATTAADLKVRREATAALNTIVGRLLKQVLDRLVETDVSRPEYRATTRQAVLTRRFGSATPRNATLASRLVKSWRPRCVHER